jgi:hypothetical protein
MRSATFTTVENLERFWKELPPSDVVDRLKPPGK